MTRPFIRPFYCKGCICEPSHLKYDPAQTGEFVPPSCDCPQHQGGPAMPGTPCDATLLAVGMAPSSEEVAQGKPLVGPAGRKFEAAKTWAKQSLEGSAVPPGPVYTKKMNLCQCRTQRPGLSRDVVNRDPAKPEIRDCAQRFLAPILQEPQLKAIQPMGQLVFRYLMAQDMKFNESINARVKHSVRDALNALLGDTK